MALAARGAWSGRAGAARRRPGCRVRTAAAPSPAATGGRLEGPRPAAAAAAAAAPSGSPAASTAAMGCSLIATLATAPPVLASADTEAPVDPVFAAGFGLAVVLLVVVTGGVAYLSYVDWNDKRIENEERAKFDAELVYRRDKGDGATRKAAVAATSKGFGAKKQPK